MSLVNILHACDIPVQTDIAKDVRFGHGALGVVVHGDTKIGEASWIMQNVTLGSKNNGAPMIEDHVLIGAGAVILGKVHIGRGAVIGANAVVVTDVPGYEVWGGVPAKKMKEIEHGENFPYFY